MKRMYVTILIIIIVMVWGVTALSQKITTVVESTVMQEPQRPALGFDRQKRRMELREEMHRRMRERLFNGGGVDDIFKDMEKEFQETFADVGTDISNFQSEWVESKTGRTLVITPKDKDQKINIDVNGGMITLKGETETKTAQSSYMSSFSNTFPVPDDCDGSKVKMDQKDGKLLIELPYKSMKTVTIPPKDERKPLSPSSQDVPI